MPLDLQRLCQKYGVPYLTAGHHHCATGWIQLHCPFCSGGRSGWHLGFNLQYSSFNCWRCGSKKSRDVIRLLTSTNDPQALRLIFDRFQLKQTTPKQTDTQDIQSKPALPPPGMGKMGLPHRRYLRSRDFRPRLLEKLWDLRGTAHLSDVWNWRIICPIRNSTGQIAAWTGRSLSNIAKPKYKTTKQKHILGDPKALLYGEHKILGNAIVIVEGPSDVWRLGPGAVATLGIDWKHEQASKLRHYDRRYIIFDMEETAQQQADKLAKWLSLFPGITEVITGLKTDPGGMAPAAARRLMKRLEVQG